MTEEGSTISHLSVAMPTNEADNAQTTEGKTMQSSSSIIEFYFQWAVVVIGVIGMATNALILYALVVSKQQKKHVLIVNQNALDLFSSFFLALVYSLKLCNLRLTGAFSYWLCMMLLSELLIWWGLIGSVVNLAIITIDRYLKVVHHTWSKRLLRPWVINSAMTFAWFVGIVANTPFMFATSGVINGACYAWVLYESNVARTASMIWYIVSFYFIILITFIFCYGRILIVVHRQARVMASHSTQGSNTSQTQSHHIQTNVIKTMILVSVFYAILWLPANVYYLFIILDTNLTYIDVHYYASMFIAFLYTTVNPFIYATKFDPVKKVLRDMIPCKKTCVQPTEGGTETTRVRNVACTRM